MDGGNSTRSNVFELQSARRRLRPDGDGSGNSAENDWGGYKAYYLGDAKHGETFTGEESWFKIYREEPRHIEMLRYDDIFQVICSVNEVLGLNCHNEHLGYYQYMLEGRNLGIIPSFIQRQRLQALALFIPSLETEEPGGDEPVILSIERTPEIGADVEG